MPQSVAAFPLLDAMGSRTRFAGEVFENIYDAFRCGASARWWRKIQAQRLARHGLGKNCFRHHVSVKGIPIYTNTIEKLNIEFSVDRLPFPTPRCSTANGAHSSRKCNEHHRHAHETGFFVLRERVRAHRLCPARSEAGRSRFCAALVHAPNAEHE